MVSPLYTWVSPPNIAIMMLRFVVRKKTSGMLYAMKMVKKSSVHSDDVRFA